jgi:hypothetical protein
VKFSELEDSSKLATQEWVEYQLKDLKSQLRLENLQRQSKLLNCAGLIGFGLIWGFVIAKFLSFLFFRK